MSNVIENARVIASELRRIGSEFQAKALDELVAIVERLRDSGVAVCDAWDDDEIGQIDGVLIDELRTAAEAAREASK